MGTKITIPKSALAIAAAIFLLLLSSGCTAPGGMTGAAPGSFWVWGWNMLAGVVLALVAALLGLGYMASVLLGDEKLKVWVKREVGQLGFSVIILIVIVALIGPLDAWLQFLITYGGSPSWQAYVMSGPCCDPATTACITPPSLGACHIKVARDYLQMLYETARLNSISFMSNNMVLSLFGNMQVSFNLVVTESQPAFSISPFAGVSAGADYFMILFDLSAKALMLVRAQQIMLDFLNYPVFGILLSMGLVLRMLYFTRKLGGLLVALALVSYVVFPMFYAISDAILWNFLGGTVQTWSPFGGTYNYATTPSPFGNQGTIAPTQNQGEVFNPSNQLQFDFCSSVNSGTSTSVSDLSDFNLMRGNFESNWQKIEGGRWYEQLGELFSVGTATGGFGPKGPVGTLATLLVLTLVSPFLAFMTLLAAVKVFSPMIGGDVEISVLSRLI